MLNQVLKFNATIKDYTCASEHLKIGPYIFKKNSPDIIEYFKNAIDYGLHENNLYDHLKDATSVAQALYIIGFCKEKGFLSDEILYQDEKLFTVFHPYSYQKTHEQIKGNDILKISRFTHIGWEGKDCVLQTPLSGVRIVLHSEKIINFLFLLSSRPTLDYLSQNSTFCHETTISILSLFTKMKIIQVNESEALKQWETHDLIFHYRTRTENTHSKIGGTFRFKDIIPPLPAEKIIKSAETISLFKPDINKLMNTDMTLTAVMEKRKSIREYKKIITLKQVGEFLYRTARVKENLDRNEFQLSKRCYPSGGAIYENELNLFINKCDGIEPGVYHYNPYQHFLTKVNELTSEAKKIIEKSKCATAKEGGIQILIVISARFQRLSWKYESMAYSVMLKHAGVMIHTFYQVATAMNLSPSGVGCGDAMLSSKALKTNFIEESSIGEFILGG